MTVSQAWPSSSLPPALLQPSSSHTRLPVMTPSCLWPWTSTTTGWNGNRGVDIRTQTRQPTPLRVTERGRPSESISRVEHHIEEDHGPAFPPQPPSPHWAVSVLCHPHLAAPSASCSSFSSGLGQGQLPGYDVCVRKSPRWVRAVLPPSWNSQ